MTRVVIPSLYRSALFFIGNAMQSREQDSFIQKLHANHRILKRYRLVTMMLVVGVILAPLQFGFAPSEDFCAKSSIVGLIWVLSMVITDIHTRAHANANGIVCANCERPLTGDANRRTALSGRCGFCDYILVPADPVASTLCEPAIDPADPAQSTLKFQCTQHSGIFTIRLDVSFVDKCSDETVLHDVQGRFTVYSVIPPIREQAQTFHFSRQDWENGEILSFCRNRLWHGYGSTITRTEIEIEGTLNGTRRKLSFDV